MGEFQLDEKILKKRIEWMVKPSGFHKSTQTHQHPEIVQSLNNLMSLIVSIWFPFCLAYALCNGFYYIGKKAAWKCEIKLISALSIVWIHEWKDKAPYYMHKTIVNLTWYSIFSINYFAARCKSDNFSCYFCCQKCSFSFHFWLKSAWWFQFHYYFLWRVAWR